jgi:hypothetical protein
MSMTLNDIISFIITTKENTDDFDWMDYPISVAFKDRDRVVLSDITSICFNGKSIQLNEEEFARGLQ